PQRLRHVAAPEPALAPMPVLQIEALEEAADPAWERGVPELGTGSLAEGIPLLHGVTLGVEPGRAAQLLQRLASAAAEHAGVSVQAAIAAEGLALRRIETSTV